MNSIIETIGIFHFFRGKRKNSKNQSIIETNKNNGVMAVEIKSDHGIGAKIIWCLEILLYCEENNLSPSIRFTYDQEEGDFFSYYFELKKKVEKSNSSEHVVIAHIDDLGLGKNYNKLLTVPIASSLFQRHIVLRKDINDEVNQFCNNNFSDKQVLGVHYRGTDKRSEAPPVRYQKVESNIKLFLEKSPKTKAVFVSTDDLNFISFIEKSDLGVEVIYRKDSFRSVDDTAIHFSDSSKYDINKDAIVNCILLSRCHSLMKCSSILSAISKLLNPEAPLVMLNEPYNDWFPDAALVKESLFQAID